MDHPIRSTLPVLLLAIAACGSDGGLPAEGSSCLPGWEIVCTCEDGRSGFGVCGLEGCDCPPEYALVADPASVDFGEVARGTSRDAVLVLQNGGSREVRLRSVVFLGDDAALFSIPDPLPSVLPAGSSLPLALRITPVGPGTPVARLRIEADDDAVAPAEVIVSGRVPGPVLACTPEEVDFANGYVDGRTTKTVVCSNTGIVGEHDQARLVLDRLDVSGKGFGIGEQEPPAGGLAVGASTKVAVHFVPTAPGEHHGTLTIGGPDGVREIPLLGRAYPTPECEIEASFPSTRGIVPLDSVTMLDLVVRNLRLDAPCAIRDVQLCEGTDPAYSLPEGGYDRVVIPGGEEARFPVQFAPKSGFCPESREVGCIEFELDSSSGGHRSIPITCSALDLSRAALVTPDVLDFGTVTRTCATRDRTFLILNVAAFPLHLRAIGFGEGTSGEFLLRSIPPVGHVLQPGSSEVVTVAYRPDDEGVDAGTIWVEFDELSEPVIANLVGRGVAPPPQRDSFMQGVRPKIDMLFVIDNGTTMGPESVRLVADLGDLAEALAKSNLDFHLAVTTTGLATGGPGCPGGANGGEDGRFFPVDGTRPRILDRNTLDLRATFEANLAVGTCHGEPPQLLEAALRALTPPLSTSADDPRHDEPVDGNLGFLRPNAHLSVIAVSDRPDASPGDDLAYHMAFQALKGEQNTHLFGFHTITGDRGTGCMATDGRSAAAGDRLIAMAERTGSMRLSICDDTWRNHLIPASVGMGVRSCFGLGSRPRDGAVSDGELRVYVDGVEVPAVTDGVQAWRYHDDQVAVCFEPGHVPAEGVGVQVEYEVACVEP